MSRAALAGVLLASLVACVGDRPTAVPSTPTTSAPPAPAPSLTQPAGEAPHPVSLPALMRKRFDGRDLTVGRVLGRTDAYTSYAITYAGSGLTISGLMNVPRGSGRFPVLILNHGYIDPDVYRTGRGFERSQEYLAREGYVVVHVDYRNHAASDDDPDNERRLRLGYIEDAINAALAVKRSSLPYLDAARVGMLGRSMGGGVTLGALVVQPDIVDAAVVFAPVSSNHADNFDRWIRRPDRARLAREIIDAYGSPEDAPAFWRNVSSRTFFDRIEVPIQIHHGTDDESVPFRWSQETLAALRAHGKDARLYTYEGEGHAFGAAYSRAMRRTVAFFDRHLAGTG